MTEVLTLIIWNSVSLINYLAGRGSAGIATRYLAAIKHSKRSNPSDAELAVPFRHESLCEP
jgi:hypothetical protein